MEPKFILTLSIVSLFFFSPLAQPPGAFRGTNPICNRPYWRPPFCNAQRRECDSASQFIHRCANFYVSTRNVQQRCCVELNPIDDNCFPQTWRWVIRDFRVSCAAYGYVPSPPRSSTSPLTSPPSSSPNLPQTPESPDQSPISPPTHKSHHRHLPKSSTVPSNQSPLSSPSAHHSHRHPPKSSTVRSNSPLSAPSPHHAHHHQPKSSPLSSPIPSHEAPVSPAPHKPHRYHSPKSSSTQTQPILPSPIQSPSPDQEPLPTPTQLPSSPREPQVPSMPPTKGRGRPENCLVDNVIYDSCDPQMPQAINGGSSEERDFIPQTISTGMFYDKVGCCISFALFTNDCNGNVKDLSFAKRRIFSSLQSRCN